MTESSADSRTIEVRLWGVRGSIPTPEAENLGYGGNTPCIEVSVDGGRSIIFDAGSGLRRLGTDLALRQTGGLPLSIFLTHFHWDHIQGLPYFAPFYDPGASLSFYASEDFGSTREVLAGVMSPPYHPVGMQEIASKCHFAEFGKEPIRLYGITIHPFPVNHPQGASGFRIECDRAVIVYVPDREHNDAALDTVVREYSQNADLLIHDAQYTAHEYATHQCWGHTTPEEAAAVARDARVKQLLLFHHDPSHDDAFVSRMASDMRAAFENTQGAREGTVISF